jgi:phosphoribosylamine--glycine ligase
VLRRAIGPTLDALQRRGIDYRGFLYAGLILTADGPKMLEYNVRFGDPEAQVVLPRVSSDLAALLAEAAAGELHLEPVLSADVCVTVICAAHGYPGETRSGDVIEGLDEAAAVPGVEIFCAGVGEDLEQRLVTAGGRVLAITGRGADLAEARARAYAAVDQIDWPGMYHRTDIGEVVAPA